MTIKKLSRYDRVMRIISHYIFKIGAKLDNRFILKASGKMLDYIAARNGCPKGRICWIHKDTIEY